MSVISEFLSYAWIFLSYAWINFIVANKCRIKTSAALTFTTPVVQLNLFFVLKLKTELPYEPVIPPEGVYPGDGITLRAHVWQHYSQAPRNKNNLNAHALANE